MLQATVEISRYGHTLSNAAPWEVSKDQRYRGMAFVSENGTYINLHEVRAALDALTLDDAEVVFVKTKGQRYNYAYAEGRNYFRWRRPYRFKLTPRGDRVAITAPCGETRVFSVRSLDRKLSQFGA